MIPSVQPDPTSPGNTFDHFAYGSNLSLDRLRGRCPSASPLAVGFVRGRQLRFHKIGRDGTGKADAWRTDDPNDQVWGVIYRCLLIEKPILDGCESLDLGYQFVPVDVHVGDEVWTTFLYEAMETAIDQSMTPAEWYARHVIDGARQHDFPRAYVQTLTLRAGPVIT